MNFSLKNILRNAIMLEKFLRDKKIKLEQYLHKNGNWCNVTNLSRWLLKG